MSERNILILGAGVYQVPLIERAKEMGYRTVVASIAGNYPGFDIADECAYVDTRDAEGLLALARDKQIKAVVTACTDVCVPALGRICDALGLPGVSERSAVLASNKIAMKRAFASYGVNTAEFRVVSTDATVEECVEHSKAIGFPVIFKAVDSSGSRGIQRVSEADGIEAALQNVRSCTQSDEFLIERCLVGTEFGMQAFVQDGETKLVLLHGDYLFEGSTAVPMGHYVPYGDATMTELGAREARQSIASLGIDNCAVNIDAMYCDGNVYIIEVGARAGATCLPELVGIRYGIDYYRAIIDCALGNPVTIPAELDVQGYAMILCPRTSGVVRAIEYVPRSADGVRFASVDVAPGDHVNEFRVGPDRIGQVVVEGTSPDTAERALFQALDAVRIRLTDGTLLGWMDARKQR